MDVRMPDGGIVRNVPEGIDKNELLTRYNTKKYGGAQIGPVTGRPQVPGAGMAQAAAQAQEIEGEIPAFQRFALNAEEHAPLLLGGTAALLAPGPGWAALGASSLLGGVGAGGGEIARQTMTREPTDLGAAAEVGGKSALTSGVAGTVLKGLGLLAGKIFRSPLPPTVGKSADFARAEGVPFPLSSAMPNSPAGVAQRGSNALLPGSIKNTADATKVLQYLNQNVGTLTEKAPVFDSVAIRGQQYFANIINPAKAGATEAWKKYAAAVGKDTPVPLSDTLIAVREARDALKSAGATSGQKGDELFTLLDSFLSVPGKARSVKELNLLNSAVISKGMKGRTKDLADEVTGAMERDLVRYAEANGSQVGQEFLSGLAQRAKYRRLAQIPEFERLAGELGAGGRGATKGSRDWMNTLFTKGNGKALGMLRKEEPEFYHELADAWLAQQIGQFSKRSNESLVRSLDGAGLRNWFVQNGDNLREFMTREQFTAMDNFTQYAELMTGAQQKAVRGFGEPGSVWTRLAGEGLAMWKNPVLMVPTEASSYVLARGLSDPNSALFKLFTQGFSEGWKTFAVKAGQLGGTAYATKPR